MPADSELVFGTVRSAEDQRPLAAASIIASWTDVGYDKSKGVTQRRWRSTVVSDSTGGFALCGMPRDEPIRITATKDSAAAGIVEVQPTARRVQRRDLFVARGHRLASRAGFHRGTGARRSRATRRWGSNRDRGCN